LGLARAVPGAPNQSLDLPVPRLRALKAALTAARARGDGQTGQQSKTDQQISFRNC